jgi:pyridoxamine 5'-phosphate oxidase
MVGKSTKPQDLSSLRIHYVKDELLEQNIGNEPLSLFSQWIDAAKASEIKEPNAMILSTINKGKPSARVVFFKGFDEKGFVFFTNYQSHKASEIAQNSAAAITFFWDTLERQVRIEGNITKVSSKDSDEYFHSRPRESQIGAWVSNQSSIVSDRTILEEKNDMLAKKFEKVEVIPRPPHWGGYVLLPSSIEFWQGRPSRLHDRILYTWVNDAWKRDRLSP